MSLTTMIIIALVIAIIGAAFVQFSPSIVNNASRGLAAGLFGDLDDFSPSISFASFTGRTGVAIDQERRKLAVAAPGVRVVPYSALLSVELLEDGSSITKVSRGSQATRALVGGVLFGGAGAIVGALGGKQKQERHAEKIELRLTLDDIGSSYVGIQFLPFRTPVGSPTHVNAMQQANEWLGRLRAVIHRAGNPEDYPADPIEPAQAQTAAAAQQIDDRPLVTSELLIPGGRSQVAFGRRKSGVSR